MIFYDVMAHNLFESCYLANIGATVEVSVFGISWWELYCPVFVWPADALCTEHHVMSKLLKPFKDGLKIVCIEDVIAICENHHILIIHVFQILTHEVDLHAAT